MSGASLWAQANGATAILLTSAVTSAALVRVLPEYSIWSSYVWTFLAIVAVRVLVLGTWVMIIWPKFLSPLRHLPQPPGGNFFWGHFVTIIWQTTGAPQREWVNSIPNDGLIRYTTIFNTERILLTSSKALGEVMVAKNYDFVKPSFFKDVLGRVIGMGLLLVEGDEHRQQRKALMPAFAYRHVKDLYPTFWRLSGHMVKAVTHSIDEQSSRYPQAEKTPRTAIVPFGEWLGRATLDIIGVAGMGKSFNAIENPNTELAQTYRLIFTPSRQATILGLLSLIFPRRLVRMIPIKRNGDIAAASASIRKVCREMVLEKERHIAANKSEELDILSVAMRSGTFPVENLVDQMMTFLAAGHETTATATQWAITALCQYPAMQERLRAEIRANLPSIESGEDLSSSIAADAFERLPYLHAFCHEILRVHSPLLMTRRVAANDTAVVGQFVPKGTDVIICAGAINMSKSMWGADALAFDPERWMGVGRANSGGATSNYAFLTFLHGPRSCIGQAFSKAEFACLLAAVAGRFRFEFQRPDEVVEVEGGVTSRPKGGVEVRTTVVEGW